MHYLLLLTFSLLFPIVPCAKILIVFHMSSYSHYQLGSVLGKSLANKGHEVTMISPFKEKNTVGNFKEVFLTGEFEKMEEFKKNMDFFKSNYMPSILRIFGMNFAAAGFAESTLNHSNVQTLLKSDEKFDLVILEQFLNEAFYGFCYFYKTPCVFISSMGSNIWTNAKMGNPGPPSYINDVFLPYSTNLNFWQRIHNTFIYLVSDLVHNTYGLYVQNQILQNYFPGSPHVTELYYNTSLMLLNSHPSINAAVPVVPNVIDIGGYHVNPPKKLPVDLQDFLDKSKNGVILFSMGSNVKSTNMPVEQREEILKAFSKVKEQVLWKWEDDNLPGQPDNVKIMKWFPQQDILAHPNVKLFVTHGGLLSIIETVYFGVPIIGLPIFADQYMNMANAVDSGYGISVPFLSVTEETLSKALIEMLSNSKYAYNAKKRSEILHDEPMKPLNKAIFWVEYVLRHKGAPHLRTAALNLTWYQYLLLDVILFYILSIFVLLCVSGKILKLLFCKKTFKAQTSHDKKSRSMKLTAFLCLSLLFSVTESAKILCVFHMPAYSHYQLGNVLAKRLANEGHEVTMVTPISEKNPPKNYREIFLTGEFEKGEELKKNLNFFNDDFIMSLSITRVFIMTFLGTSNVESTLNHPNVQTLLKSDEKFDLVIMEQFGNEAFNGFCHFYNASCVFVSTMGAHVWTNSKMGNPGPPSYVNDIFLPYPKHLNFLQRLHTSFTYLLTEIVQNTFGLYLQNQLLQKYFPGSPHVSELYYNASLMLLNSHPSTNPAVPLLPNMINIGGYHVTPPKQLPDDLQQFLDKSKEGVILFSMGSNLKAKDMPIAKRDAILKSFAKLKQQVLWKWEADSLPGQPKNVKLLKWIPQQSVLAHPNVKLFITHGGLLSTIETVYFGVPVIGIPTFADQKMNMANAEASGYGISVPFLSLTEELFTNALDRILSDLSYAKNAKKSSEILHDEPMKPLEKAVFWIEYVLRHKGAPHLRTAALNLYWWQYLLLDVIAFYGVVVFVLLFLSRKIFKIICNRIRKTTVKPKKKKN